MNDNAHSIAVVRTRLPYIDRRALSQAWFSALHVAATAPAARLRRAAKSSTPALRSANAAAPAPSGRRPAISATPSSPSIRAAGRARWEASCGVTARSAKRADSSRTAAAALHATHVDDDARSYPPFQTSLTVGVEGARVALLLRRQGPTLHVVALCAPANVELVRRALACADAHLRLRGDSVRASVRSTAEVRA